MNGKNITQFGINTNGELYVHYTECGYFFSEVIDVNRNYGGACWLRDIFVKNDLLDKLISKYFFSE